MKTFTLASLILAAGQGTRMKSTLPKVIHVAAGWPLISYPVHLCEKLGIQKTTIIVGKNQNLGIPKVNFAVQDPPRGTGDAVKVGLATLKNFSGDILILCGDMPLVQLRTIEELLQKHRNEKNILTFLTAKVPQAGSLGRIVRDQWKVVQKIVEFKDASPAQKKINEVNLGIYLVQADFLKKALKEIKPENAQKEYYLTDIVTLALHAEKKVGTLLVQDSEEALGVNTQKELLEVQKILYRRRWQKLLENGAHLVQPESIVIGPEVEIGSNVEMLGPVYLLGKTKIGNNCRIEPGVWIQDSTLADHVVIKANSYITESSLGKGVHVGPMAHLRPGSRLGEEVKIGNFVEIKKSSIDVGSKVNHLSYIGDATIGKKVNIGAGTITCNYDGVHKYQTILEDGVFVGSDTQFVAPVTVGKGAFIGAGSTITKNVSAESLALSRTPQKEIRGWKRKK